MVNRLRKALSLKTSKRAAFNDVVPNTDNSANDSELPRDMDDEDMDGEFFDSNDTDDYDDSEKDDDIRTETGDSDEVESPLQAHILPLYSLLSADEQMKIFRPPPEGHRLIIISTNVAETSLTIPGISYVVDSGRQKCRNFNAGTGVASYDIMWISKAAANQRAGRAGRTGPGHCYRLYSSSMFARHMDDFELPEVLTRPLEDVVLAMKAMRVSQVANFPFPTPPDQAQLKAALNLLANIGCVDLSKADEREDDGTITRLGAAVSKLPLGVRYGKMLLVGAQACVLDYAIAVVAVLSEASPFLRGGEQRVETTEVDEEINDDDDNHSNKPRSRCHRWEHKGGDVLAAMLAVGAYSYAGRGAGGESEKMAHKKFCDENDLNLTIMNRIHKMRIHLARLSKVRLSDASGVAAKTGGILSSMDPPDKVQESLLRQAIASGLVDNIAMLAPLGSIPGDHPFSLRSAYISCSCTAMEPLFMDQSSVVFSRDARKLPQWICYDSIQRKTYKDGTPIAVMKNITPVDPSWLGNVAAGTKLLRLGDPVSTPLPTYDRDTDTVMCSVSTYLGCMGWEIPPVRVEMFNAVQCTATKQNYHFAPDDSFRWFARFLLEGKILPEFAELQSMLNDSPAVITRATTLKKVVLLVAALSNAGIDCGAALRKHWAEVNDKFLFANLKQWVKNDRADEAKQIWILAVRRSIAGNTECN
jgi:ATP-dependent RNA helicase DHX37/DHR1